MGTIHVSIHPAHPSAHCRYTLETLSRLAHTGWQATGTYYVTLETAEEKRAELERITGDPVRVAAIVNTHPLFS